MKKLIRLFTHNQGLRIGNIVRVVDNDFFYLTVVMKKKECDKISLFNGENGEFVSKISNIEKNYCDLEIIKKIKEQIELPFLGIAFCLVKNVKNEFIASKSTELGVTNFYPIITQRTIVRKINKAKFNLNIKESLEQCGRMDFPKLSNITSIHKFIKENNSNSKSIFILCDESGNGKSAKEIFSKIKIERDTKIILIIGPEGGFTEQEFIFLKNNKNLYSLSLGKYILRVDTAIISSLTLVKEFYNMGLSKIPQKENENFVSI